MANINTQDYWDTRFETKDWEAKGGYFQTRHFAESQVLRFRIDRDFEGVICDFGCGTGDAFPVYRREYPKTSLVGVDFSKEAIKLCVERYGDFAKFYCGTAIDVPEVDIIICSNVFEHIDDDVGVLKQLLERCKTLYVIVPYKESPLCPEHVHYYDKNSFSDFSPISKSIFLCKGWRARKGFDLLFNIYLKNIVRSLLGRKIITQNRQIMYKFAGRQRYTELLQLQRY